MRTGVKRQRELGMDWERCNGTRRGVKGHGEVGRDRERLGGTGRGGEH